MPISASELSGIDWDTPSEPVKKPKEPVDQGPKETGTSYVARTGAKAFGEGLGRNRSYVDSVVAHLEATRGAGYALTLPISALYAFLPKQWADKFNPLAEMPTLSGKPVKDKISDTADITGQLAAEIAGRAMKGVGIDSPTTGEVGAAPGPISHGFGTMADFTGAGLAQPIPMGQAPKVGKYALMSAGVGAGSEAGSIIGRQADKLAGGEGQTGETAGSLIGGMAAGPLNVIRGNAAVEAVKAPSRFVSDMASAAKSAYARWKEDSTRSLFSLFGEDWENLRASTKNIVQDKVNKTISEAIAMDPQAPDNIKAFDEAAKATGFDPAKASLAQRTGTPSLIGTQASMKPQTPEQVAELSRAYENPKNEVIRVAKRISENTVNPTAKSAQRALEELRKTENLKVQALDEEAHRVADTTPRMDVGERTTIGNELKRVYEAELEAGSKVKNQFYEDRNNLGNQMGVALDINPAVDKVKDILKEAVTKANPDLAPDTIRNLRLLATKKGGENLKKVMESADPDVKAFFEQHMGVKQEGISVKDWGDVLTLVNNDLHAAARGNTTEARMKAQNLVKIQQALEEVLQTAPPEVIAAHNAATEHFKNVFVPRFREGTNYNLSREASAARMGQDYIDPASVFSSQGYFKRPTGVNQVSETSMQEFDNLFGGVLPGTKRVESAYNGLWRGIESDYAEGVLAKGKFNPDAHEKFLNQYEAALNRVPALRDKLDRNASKILKIENEKDRIEQRFKEIVGGPLSTAVGAEAAQNVLSHAVVDPRKMGQLISALNQGEKANGQGAQSLLKEVMYRANPFVEGPNGAEFEPNRLNQLLQRGSGRDGQPGGLQVLFRAALGRREGDAHMDRLRKIALIADRVDATNPRYLRPQELVSDDPIKAGTGQTTASWITSLKAAMEGRISGTYVGGVGVSRFFNTKLQQAYSEAQMKALFDPQMSQAVLQMMETPANGTVSYNAAKKVFGHLEGFSEWAKDLIEHGQLKKYMMNSGRLAITKEANDDKDAPQKRERFYEEPYINRRGN